MPSPRPLVVAIFVASGLLAGTARAGIPARLEGTELVAGTPAKIEFSAASRATVIVFVSAKCPCSAAHEEALEALRAQYESRGVRFVGLHANQDETAAEGAAHFRASPVKFPVLADAGAKQADAFGALKTPHVYVVDPRGEVLYQGGVDDSHAAGDARKHYLADALAAIAEGRRPEVSKTRTLGCVISRKP